MAKDIRGVLRRDIVARAALDAWRSCRRHSEIVVFEHNGVVILRRRAVIFKLDLAGNVGRRSCCVAVTVVMVTVALTVPEFR